MAQMGYEQENDVFTGGQHSVIGGIPKVQTTALKTPLNKSSRKAFGNERNVNVFQSDTTQTSIGAKPKRKANSVPKAPEELKTGLKPENKAKGMDVNPNPVVVKTGLKPENKAKGIDPKFLDEMEHMYPMEGELITDMNDPVSHGLYDIDDQTVFAMVFDSDMAEGLVPRDRDFDLNDFL